MSLRTTRQRRTHGPDALSDQLAEHDSHNERRRAETRVIDPFGWADQVDPDALRRLAQRLLRVAHDARSELPARQFPPEVGIDDMEQVDAEGRLAVAQALGQELGLGPSRRANRQPDGGEAPHDTA